MMFPVDSATTSASFSTCLEPFPSNKDWLSASIIRPPTALVLTDEPIMSDTVGRWTLIITGGDMEIAPDTDSARDVMFTKSSPAGKLGIITFTEEVARNGVLASKSGDKNCTLEGTIGPTKIKKPGEDAPWLHVTSKEYLSELLSPALLSVQFIVAKVNLTNG
jgi:hypothetical protein